MATLMSRIEILEQQRTVSDEPLYSWADVIQTMDDPHYVPPAIMTSKAGQTLDEWNKAISVIHPYDGIFAY